MLIKHFHYSGGAKMFLWVAKTLASRGHKIVIVTYKKSENVTLPSNITWFNNEDLDGKSLFKIIFKVRSIIKEEHPDISISFLLDANIINILACLKLKTKSIFCERLDPFKPGYYKLKLLKPIFRYADGAVYQLKKVAEYYNNFKGEYAVIPNPVKINSAIKIDKPFNDRENRIVYMARMDLFQKRQDLLIDSFELFVKKHPEYKLFLYGNGPDEVKIKQIIALKGLEEKVFMPGISNNAIEELINSKFNVMTSDFEGIPNALIEAMAVGLPCISTDCSPGGASLLIENGKNGFLVDRNDKKAIVEKMNWIAEHGEEADQIGKEAMNVSQRFNEKIIGDMWDNFVRDFL